MVFPGVPLTAGASPRPPPSPHTPARVSGHPLGKDRQQVLWPRRAADVRPGTRTGSQALQSRPESAGGPLVGEDTEAVSLRVGRGWPGGRPTKLLGSAWSPMTSLTSAKVPLIPSQRHCRAVVRTRPGYQEGSGWDRPPPRQGNDPALPGPGGATRKPTTSGFPLHEGGENSSVLKAAPLQGAVFPTGLQRGCPG